jgi:hypothetical protein
MRFCAIGTSLRSPCTTRQLTAFWRSAAGLSPTLDPSSWTRPTIETAPDLLSLGTNLALVRAGLAVVGQAIPGADSIPAVVLQILPP